LGNSKFISRGHKQPIAMHNSHFIQLTRSSSLLKSGGTMRISVTGAITAWSWCLICQHNRARRHRRQFKDIWDAQDCEQKPRTQATRDALGKYLYKTLRKSEKEHSVSASLTLIGADPRTKCHIHPVSWPREESSVGLRSKVTEKNIFCLAFSLVLTDI